MISKTIINHWVFWGTQHFQTNPYISYMKSYEITWKIPITAPWLHDMIHCASAGKRWCFSGLHSAWEAGTTGRFHHQGGIFQRNWEINEGNVEMSWKCHGNVWITRPCLENLGNNCQIAPWSPWSPWSPCVMCAWFLWRELWWGAPMTPLEITYVFWEWLKMLKICT